MENEFLGLFPVYRRLNPVLKRKKGSMGESSGRMASVGPL
jgi:hypothetical protein